MSTDEARKIREYRLDLFRGKIGLCGSVDITERTSKMAARGEFETMRKKGKCACCEKVAQKTSYSRQIPVQRKNPHECFFRLSGIGFCAGG
jgi:hypothetical protein